jgi:hypothetical protein
MADVKADEKIETYAETVTGFASGTVRDNWGAVDENAWGLAKHDLFESLHQEPGVAYVVVEDLEKRIQDHGKKYRYNGKFTKEMVPGSEHAHTDYSNFPTHKFKRWQGNRAFKYTFEVIVTTI